MTKVRRFRADYVKGDGTGIGIVEHGGKDRKTTREGLRESAYSRKYTSDEVSSIIRKRLSNINKYIEALEMENAALNTQLKELKENDKR